MGFQPFEAQSIFAFGPHQTNYQTPVAPSASPKNYRWITKEGYEKAGTVFGKTDNSGYSTGSVRATEQWNNRDETTFAAKEMLTYQLLGIRAYDAFGVAATPTVVVASEVWLHTFSLLDVFTTSQLPSRPLHQKIAEPSNANQVHDRNMPSMVYDTFQITDQDQAANLILNSTWRGSGKIVETLNSTPYVIFYGGSRHVWQESDIAAEHKIPINRRAAVVRIYPQVDFGGSVIATTCLTRGFEININENLLVDAGYEGCALFQDDDPEKGAIAGSMPSGGQDVTANLNLVADSAIIQALQPLEKAKTSDKFSIQIEFDGPEIGSTGENHNALFKLNNVSLESLSDPAVVGGQQGVALGLKLLDSANALPLTLELQTNVASFATYVAA